MSVAPPQCIIQQQRTLKREFVQDPHFEIPEQSQTILSYTTIQKVYIHILEMSRYLNLKS
jgi:hypothetical protein